MTECDLDHSSHSPIVWNDSPIVLGVDPGFTGALAWYQPASGLLVIRDMPTIPSPKGKTTINHIALFDMIQECRETFTDVSACLEFVASRPGQGAPATFRFGQGYGALEMAVAACRIPITYVTPAKWKKHFHLSKNKGASRGLATQKFPQSAELFQRVKDDGRAEAALIALYHSETTP